MNRGPINYGAPINWAHPLNRGLVSWWLPLPNWSGGTKLFDITGRYHLTLGATTEAPAWRPEYLLFDGSDDLTTGPLISGTALDASGYSGFTLSIQLLHPGNTGVVKQIAGCENYSGYAGNYWCRLNDGGSAPETLDWCVFAGGAEQKSTATLTKDVMHNVDMVFSAGSQAIYIDGVLATSRTPTSGSIASPLGSTRFDVGQQKDSSKRYEGRIYSVKFFNRVVSASELAEIDNLHRQDYGSLLNRIPSRVWSFAQVGGGFQPAWARRSNVIIQPLVSA